MTELSTAVPSAGTVFMADVRRKRALPRRAVCFGDIRLGPVAFAAVTERRLPKGDALMVAEIAGIQGAKNASLLLPLCHPLPLELVRISWQLLAPEHAIRVYCEVATTAKTGVEMEAMAGATAALLCVYDLCKPVEPALRIDAVQLLFKEGGKSGLWLRPEGLSLSEREQFKPRGVLRLDGESARVITLSDRAASGIYADESGPEAARLLRALGAKVDEQLLPDGIALLAQQLQDAAAAQLDLVICTGGTGLGPRDLTPEALSQVASRLVPSLGEMLRTESMAHTHLAYVSRALAGIVGERTLVICLPGSPKAVREGIAILAPVLKHCLCIMRGEPAP